MKIFKKRLFILDPTGNPPEIETVKPANRPSSLDGIRLDFLTSQNLTRISCFNVWKKIYKENTLLGRFLTTEKKVPPVLRIKM